MPGEDDEELDDDVIPWLTSSCPSCHVILALVNESAAGNSWARELAFASVTSVSHNDQFMIFRDEKSKRIKIHVREDDGPDKTK